MALLFLVHLIAAAAFAEDCSKAREYYDRGKNLLNYEDRRAMFQKAVDLCPSYAEAHCNLADALENLGILKKKFDEQSLTQGNALLGEAEKHYKRALELKSNLYQAHIGLGEIYLGQDRLVIAAEEFTKALNLSSGDDKAKEGIEKVKTLLASEPGPGLRKHHEIVKRAKDAVVQSDQRVMGIEDHTVKDRESFNNILFEGWSSRISAGEPMAQLKEIGEALASAELAGFNFVVEGHTNIVGGFDDNMKLSWDRAKSVKNYLVNNYHVDADRLVIQGFGYTRPKFRPENDSKNRRVEILFLEQKQMR